jgi:hypothetical protein
MAVNINYEYIYQLIFQKKWIELINFITPYSKDGWSDELVMRAMKSFENEFFKELDEHNSNENNLDLLLKLFIIDKGRLYKFAPEYMIRIVREIVKIYQAKNLAELAYKYAMFCPNDEICAEIIRKHEKLLPKVLEHSQSDKIKVTENPILDNIDYTINFFKYQDKIDFFLAIKEVFQMYVVYPNVALSCLIDFKKIEDKLSINEKDIFFKTIVDCVIFDQRKNYKPIKFYQLDSYYHELPEHKIKNSYKDKFFTLAGQKLYRIRKTSNGQGKADFIKLIKEIT